MSSKYIEHHHSEDGLDSGRDHIKHTPISFSFQNTINLQTIQSNGVTNLHQSQATATTACADVDHLINSGGTSARGPVEYQDKDEV